MPEFEYQALTLEGKHVAGVLAGASTQSVLSELEARSLTPVSVTERKERKHLWRPRVSARRLGMSYTQLSDMLRSGVPLLRALRLLGGRRTAPRLSEVFRELADAVADGDELAEAMSRRGEVFPAVHVAMVRAGERGGFLEGVLGKLGEFVTRQADLKSKLIGNLIYPMVLIVVGSAVLGAIFAFAVPMFRPIVEQQESLPLTTKIVFALSDAVGSAWALVTFGVLATLVFGVWRMSRKPATARRVAAIRTRMPVVGPLTRAVATARFCRMLGTMLENGIPILTAMQIARDSAGNVLMEEAIEDATEAVRAGEPLAPPLSQSGLFADDVIEMITVAEAAGNLPDVLVTISDTVDGRVERLLNAVVRLVEPLFLVVIAVVIGFVAAGLILPMMNMSSAIGS